MNSLLKFCYIAFCCCLLFISHASFGQARLPLLISNGMVLQRDAKVKIWGWASAGEKVSVSFYGKTYVTTTGNDGKWSVVLPPLKAGGPYGMEINASNHITLSDILVGDVWICSGQSNMELPMERVAPVYETEIAGSENMYIRQFVVPKNYNFHTPQDDMKKGNWLNAINYYEKEGSWLSANPQRVLKFSAVAYFYAKALYQKYHIPVGIINASLGGSPIEAWMSEEALVKFPAYYSEALRYRNDSLIKHIEMQDKMRTNAWYAGLRANDQGYKDMQKTWFMPDLNTSDWQVMKVPGYWFEGGPGRISGVVWFRKDMDIPPSMAGKPAKIILGRIVDADSVFVNGIFVGTTSYQYPPRRYTIPPDVLTEGKNTIVIRVISNTGNGGFVEDKPYEIMADGQTIDLKGEWRYKVGARMEPLQGSTFICWKPMGLYNAMIAPLLSYSIKGVIWYQGEANTGRPTEYAELLPGLINDWRAKWNQGDFPFLFAQLPNFMKPKENPSESNWALFREAQLKTLSVPHTGMAVTIDIGEWNDIHPLNKKDVGIRLALAAQKVAYGENNIVYSGPRYKSMKIKGNKIILSFDNIGSGLIAKGGELKQFAIAGNDKQFVWAKATISKNKVIVWSDKVSCPVAVRYAWADNPAGANLYNAEGLPASPFRAGE